MTWRSDWRIASWVTPTSAAGLELTGKGPMLQFGVDSVIALTGATMTATLEGRAVSILGAGLREVGQCAHAR